MKCLAFNEALASEELFVCNFQQPASRKDPTFAKAKPARMGHPEAVSRIEGRPPARLYFVGARVLLFSPRGATSGRSPTIVSTQRVN